jgi:NitT/TauT family transport system substrate-binding protein
MRRISKRGLLALTAAAAGFAAAPGLARADALQTVKVGKAIVSSFPFAALELGEQQGIWKSVGLDLQIVTLSGDGQLQQALAANSVDFGVGGGPGMGYAVKGVPDLAVAVIANQPANMSLVVSNQSGVKSAADLKGKQIGVTTAGSLTDWLVRRTAVAQGWDASDIETVPMGDMRTRLAAMQTGQIAGAVTALQEGVEIQDRHEGKLLMTFGKVVPHFFTHVIFARDDVIKNHPDEVRRFLKGWFTVAKFMRTHRAQTVKSVAATMKLPEKVIDQTYDTEIGMMSKDGAFDPQGLEVIRQSLKDLGILDSTPSVSQIYTAEFVPVDIK